MQLSVPYHTHPLTPVFGQSTSKANFCEEDFVVTGWIGEFVNTLSNVAYVIYAIRGLRRLPKGSSIATMNIHLGLAFVGVCSGLFHALLKYHAQMSDETSMIVATSFVLHRAMTYKQSATFTRWFSIVLLVAVAVETAYHSIMDEQTVHELSFASLVITVAIKTRSLIKTRVKAIEERQMLQKMSYIGVGCFLFGYFLWNLDFIYCSELTALKRAVGMPWAFVFEFHGWWHILTAVGAHIFMIMVDNLTREEVAFTHSDFSLLGRDSAVNQKQD